MKNVDILISATQTTNKAMTQRGDVNENEPEKIAKMYLLHGYLKSNTTQRGHRKRMIEIWANSTRFNTSQRHADQARMILKKISFSDLEILELGGKVNREE